MFPFLQSSHDMPRRASLGRLVTQSTTLLMTVIGTLILLLALLILFHENSNATNGYQLRGLETERSVLLLKQEVLNMQIAQAQALEHLKQDPEIVGMTPIEKPQYVKTDQAGSGKAVAQ
ncbi:hypothetical protein HY213_02615 [Candidatus Peregrinibacteria bacterium]|nr:hypothetical protein [Candidatus Peregrinibacteria bacterium]